MDDMILYLKDKAQVVLLPRGSEQAKHYEQEKFGGVVVQSKALSLEEIAGKCKLFIGAGGTMTREMAVAGIPTISVYQDDLLDVDTYLLENGMMEHRPDLTGEQALEYLENCEQKDANDLLLRKGRETYYLIKGLLISRLSN